MPDEMVVLTPERLQAGSNVGAFNAKQLAMLGVPWPPPSGWYRRVCGSRITASSYAAFLAARKVRVKPLKTPSLFESLGGRHD